MIPGVTVLMRRTRCSGSLRLPDRPLTRPVRFCGRSYQKSTRNLVTDADLASEQCITRIIRDAFPDHQLLREESDSDRLPDAEHLWVIDPLDATNNYAHGIPHFCLSIAYTAHGLPQVGLVYDPLREEMFLAIRGRGATLNDRSIQVTADADLPGSIIATGFYYERGESVDRTLAAVRRLFRHNVRGMRRMGAAALDLCYVAAGRFQGFFEYHLAPWDYAAGWLIVEEAGGVCHDRDGGPMSLGARSTIVAAPGIAPQMRELTCWRAPDCEAPRADDQ